MHLSIGLFMVTNATQIQVCDSSIGLFMVTSVIRILGMWTVTQERDCRGKPTCEVIHIDSIARAAHLLPIYGSSRVPEDFDYHDALDAYNAFFVNHFIDNHTHEFIGGL